jgi:hypothetical protein
MIGVAAQNHIWVNWKRRVHVFVGWFQRNHWISYLVFLEAILQCLWLMVSFGPTLFVTAILIKIDKKEVRFDLQTKYIVEFTSECTSRKGLVVNSCPERQRRINQSFKPSAY